MSDTPLILVVEDASSILDIIIPALREAGFRTRSARTAMEGIRAARQELPDLILADVTLPDQDGATAMSCLKDNPEFKNVPLILVSALPHEQLLQKMSECGAVEVMHPPFEAAKLISSVKHWLAASSAGGQEEESTPPGSAFPRSLRGDAGLEADRGATGRRKAFEIITREVSPGIGELRIIGSIGISSLNLVEASFQDLFKRKLYRILINLKETRSVYSAGIGCFLAARDTAMKSGGDVVFVSTPPDLKKLFTMLGLSKILRSAEDEEKALAQLASADAGIEG